MTRSPRPDPLVPPVRRPAAPVGTLADVTHLAPPGAGPESVGLASVQGTLALDLERQPQPCAPELHLVPEQREVQVWAARFAQATVEVLGGDRPVSQLLRWTTARVYQDLDRRARILRRAAAPERRRTVRPQVHSVHVFRPTPGSAEVSVHVRHGHRSRAIAARLERRGGRWRCVDLQLG